MAIQHAVIPDIYIHEPKGIASAPSGLVYVSNGSGSGSWVKTSSAILQGLAGDGGLANRKILTDGTNGFKLVTDTAYGSMVVTNNTNNFAVPGAADPALNSPADYVLFTGTGAPLTAGDNMLSTLFSTNRLTVTNGGKYRISITATLVGHTVVTARVGLRWRINGTTFSARRTAARGNANTAGYITQMHMEDIISLAPNDYVQIMAAGSAAGAILIEDLTCHLTLISAI